MLVAVGGEEQGEGAGVALELAGQDAADEEALGAIGRLARRPMREGGPLQSPADESELGRRAAPVAALQDYESG